jgi:Flp pilus assembly protein TadD
VKTHNNLGLVLVDCGQIDEAIAHYRRALEIRPDFAEAQYNLGIALAQHGQAAEAIAHFRTALDLFSARNNWAQADDIRLKIRRLQSVNPAGNAQ